MATTLMPELKRALRLPVEMDGMRQQFIKLLGASLVNPNPNPNPNPNTNTNTNTNTNPTLNKV